MPTKEPPSNRRLSREEQDTLANKVREAAAMLAPVRQQLIDAGFENELIADEIEGMVTMRLVVYTWPKT